MSKIFLEILDIERQKVFKNLGPFKEIGYLAGGTALALQIKHRLSFDLDIFIFKAIDNKLKQKVESVFDQNKYYVDTTDQISFTTKENISITFVWYYPQPLLPLIQTPSISLASTSDIAADKAHTLGRRAIWRDYVDIYFFLKLNLLTLEQIISLAEKKFGNEFNQALFLQQLVYFKDLKTSPITFLHSSPTTFQIQTFLSKKVEAYLKKVLKKKS